MQPNNITFRRYDTAPSTISDRGDRHALLLEICRHPRKVTATPMCWVFVGNREALFLLLRQGSAKMRHQARQLQSIHGHRIWGTALQRHFLLVTSDRLIRENHHPQGEGDLPPREVSLLACAS